MRLIRLFMAGALLAAAVISLAQQGAPPPAGKKGGGFRKAPPEADGTAGFARIFDGQSLKDWDGDPGHWRVEDGAIVGESTAERPLKGNTFLVWRGGWPKDFELKLQYRINSTNSGIQYRSSEVPGDVKWVLKGYQADIDAQNTYTGQLYEERGRGFLAMRGQYTRMMPGRKLTLLGSPGDGEELKALIRNGDWNDFHIIARDNVIIHTLNGRVMAMFIDDDPPGRTFEGLLGFQLHTGPPMKVEFREIWLKDL